MTRIISTNGGAFGAQMLVPSDDKRLCDQVAYSSAWQTLGPDALWSRSAIIAAGATNRACFWGNLMSWGDSWDPFPYMQEETKVGQKRDGFAGVTRDSSGNVLGSCEVLAFDVASLTLVDKTTSDANGNFTVTTPFTGQSMFVRARLAGSPDVMGSSDNLTPS